MILKISFNQKLIITILEQNQKENNSNYEIPMGSKASYYYDIIRTEFVGGEVCYIVTKCWANENETF